MSVKKFSSAIAILGLMLFMVLACANNVRAQSYPLDSMWVSPPAINYNQFNASVGTLFNVTIWAYMENSTYTWQATLHFNPSVFQEVNTGYSAGGTSEFFAGHTTIPVSPVIDNVNGMVQSGESLLGSIDFEPQKNASLMFVEFNVTAMPNATTTPFTGLFDINATGLVDTFFLDTNGNTIISESNLYDATYTLTYAPPPPTIGTATKVPTIVNDSQVVTVSVNVTDNSGTGIKNVTLVYSKDGYVTNYTTPMTLNATTGLYNGTIPGYPMGTTVKYDTKAYDNAGNFAEKDQTPYAVVPEFSSVALLLMMMSISAAAVLIARRKHSR